MAPAAAQDEALAEATGGATEEADGEGAAEDLGDLGAPLDLGLGKKKKKKKAKVSLATASGSNHGEQQVRLHGTSQVMASLVGPGCFACP